MKKYFLLTSIAVCLVMVRESQAGIVKQGCDCGTNCCYNIDETGHLTISLAQGAKTGKIKDAAFFGYAYYHGININSIDIQEGIIEIGAAAFVTSKLSGKSVKLPDSLISIGDTAFYSCGDPTLEAPDSITTVGGSDAFGHGTIICRGENCDNVERLYNETQHGYHKFTFGYASSEQCTGNYGWNGKNCVKKDEDGKVTCASGFVEWDSTCLSEYPFAKKRWTPAEANEWLHDGNDNFVVITFKK